MHPALIRWTSKLFSIQSRPIAIIPWVQSWLLSFIYAASTSDLLLVPILSQIILDTFQWHKSILASVYFFSSITSMFSGLLYGHVADYVNSKSGGIKNGTIWFLVGELSTLAGLFANIPSLFIIGRFLVAIGSTGIQTLVFPLIAQHTKSMPLEKLFSYLVAIGGVGVSLLTLFSWIMNQETLFISLLVIYFVIFSFCWFLLYDPQPENNNPSELDDNDDTSEYEDLDEKDENILFNTKIPSHEKILLVKLSMMWTLQSLMYWGINSFIPIFLAGLKVDINSAIFGMQSSGLIPMLLFYYLAKHYSFVVPLRLFVGGAFSGLFIVVLIFLLSPGSTVLLFVFLILFYSNIISMYAGAYLYSTTAFPETVRSSRMGVITSVIAFSAAVGPFISAFTVDSTLLFSIIFTSMLFGEFAITFTLDKNPLNQK